VSRYVDFPLHSEKKNSKRTQLILEDSIFMTGTSFGNQTRGIQETCMCNRTVVVLRADSPGKVAQWFAESIPESWGVLWLVISFLSGQADVSSSVITVIIHPCTAFPSTLVSMLELSPPLTILLLPRVGGLSALSTRAVHYTMRGSRCVHDNQHALFATDTLCWMKRTLRCCAR
jgi:hypothetical protein